MCSKQRLSLIYFLLLMLSACSSDDTIKEKLIGVWHGQDEEQGFRWCLSFFEDKELSIKTLQRALYDTQENWESRARATQYSGTWLFTDGNRLMLYPDFENAEIKNRSPAAEKLSNLVLPAYYIIGDIDQFNLRKTSHPRGIKGSWIESSRTANCAPAFNLAND